MGFWRKNRRFGNFGPVKKVGGLKKTTTVENGSEKYPRTSHFPFSEGAVNDDRICYDWFDLLDAEIVVTEKLDGENSCLKKSGVYARSHAAPNRHPWARPVWDIWENIGRSLGEFHIFGENLYAVHSIEYERLEHYFHIFAIREGNTWLSWDEVRDYARVLDLPTVPLIARGRFEEPGLRQLIADKQRAGSAFGGTCEGVVCRDAAAFGDADFSKKVLKFVRKNHVQTDEHWTRNWQRAPLWFERQNA